MSMGCKRCVGEHQNGEACPVESPSSVAGDSLEGQRHGPLLLKRRLEIGAVASVYLAEYVPTGHRFAVKVLHAHLAARPAVRARFISEALAQRNVVHRHVARVLDVRPGPQGLPCVLMEAPEGESLSAMPLPLSAVEAGEVLDQALAGLEAAHARGLVHGDLTMDSLVVTRDSKGARRVLVRDFGANLVRDAALSREERARGVSVGSPTFMAPEQATGISGGPRSDVHSLGVAGYLLVTGRLPFGLGRSADVVLFPPHALNASVPPALSTVLLRALAARPEDRFDSARDFRVALAEALGLEIGVRDASADAREDVSSEVVTERDALDDIDIVEDVPAWGDSASSMEDAALRASDGISSDSRAGEVAMRAEVAAFWASAVALLGPAEPENTLGTAVASRADSSGSAASSGAQVPMSASSSPVASGATISVTPIMLTSPLDIVPAPAHASSTLGSAAIPFMHLAPTVEAAPIPLIHPASSQPAALPIALVDRVSDAASATAPLENPVAPLEASAPRTDAPSDLRVRLGLTPGEVLQAVSVSDVAPEGLFVECRGSLPPLAARLPVEVSFRGETAVGACDVVRHVTFDEARIWNVPAGVFVHFSDEYPALGRLLMSALTEDLEPAPDAELARMLSRAEAVARDPYTLLGAKPDADFGDVRRRAQAALRRLDAFNGRALPTAQRQSLEALRLRVQTAQRMLGEPLSRVGYDATRGNVAGLARCVAAGVPEPTMEALRSAFLAARPEVELKARALFTQGHALEVQRSVPAALECYAEALKLDPLNTSWLRHYQSLREQVPAGAGARMTGAMA
ncbi:protein kinase domain-containing protein [Corallococcus terminator]|uniref:Serine/threonine protein kinase n=1 Tax=Corallococcus terminator TaxID=2316733 RepID=A0A3A8JDG3_9BACT|nr:protein kinase [Corallococcus terminator]RKG88541.1 serine/threonine protein kinase [Corallococcus terminator]